MGEMYGKKNAEATLMQIRIRNKNANTKSSFGQRFNFQHHAAQCSLLTVLCYRSSLLPLSLHYDEQWNMRMFYSLFANNSIACRFYKWKTIFRYDECVEGKEII